MASPAVLSLSPAQGEAKIGVGLRAGALDDRDAVYDSIISRVNSSGNFDPRCLKRSESSLYKKHACVQLMDPHTATLPIRSSVNGVLTRVAAIHPMRSFGSPAQTPAVGLGRPGCGVGR